MSGAGEHKGRPYDGHAMQRVARSSLGSFPRGRLRGRRRGRACPVPLSAAAAMSGAGDRKGRPNDGYAIQWVGGCFSKMTRAVYLGWLPLGYR